MLLSVCPIGLHCMAQEPAPVERSIHNTTVFVEVWGEGIYNSVNMEKTGPPIHWSTTTYG